MCPQPSGYAMYNRPITTQAAPTASTCHKNELVYTRWLPQEGVHPEGKQDEAAVYLVLKGNRLRLPSTLL